MADAVPRDRDHFPDGIHPCGAGGYAAVADVCGFDYVLQLEADAVPPLPPERFHLLVRSGYAALYTIIQCYAP